MTSLTQWQCHLLSCPGQLKTFGQSGFLLEDISQETENHIVPEVQNNPTRFPSGLVVLRFKEKNQQLSQAVDALMLNTGHGWSCLGCGKQTPRKQYMMKHVEVHIEGFSHICDYCKNNFKTRGSLQVHLSQSLSCKHAHSKIYCNTVMDKFIWGRKELRKLSKINSPFFVHCVKSYGLVFSQGTCQIWHIRYSEYPY